MTKTKLITKTEVQRVVKQIVAENPDAVNPTVRGTRTCLYHKGRGRNIRRCIIGQAAFELGLPTPAADYGAVSDVAWDGVWKNRFTDAALNYAENVQLAADGQYGADPIPWGKIPKSVINGRS
jgi:hypothetical protein